MQIHQVQIGNRPQWRMDPDRGMVQQQVQELKPSTTHQITHDGVEYDIQPDGTFEVPNEVGHFLLARSALGWREGPNPFFVPEDESDVDPETPFELPQSTARKASKATKRGKTG